MTLFNLAGTVENKLVLNFACYSSMAGAKPNNTPLILRNLVQGGRLDTGLYYLLAKRRA